MLNKEIRNKFIKEIEYQLKINKIEPSFYLSVIDQCIEDDCFKDLYCNLKEYSYYIHTSTSDNPFEEFVLYMCFYDKNGDELPYQYRLIFGYREIMEGYCYCTENDKGYDWRYKCTGERCDWDKPFVNIEKVYHIEYREFEGMQKDLWKYKDKYYKIKVDQKEEKKKAKIKDIKNQIKNLQEKLDKLYEEE